MTPPLHTEQTPRRRHLAVLALLSLLVSIAYANSLTNEFIYADEVLVMSNKFIKSLDYLPTMFIADWFEGTDFPMGEKRYRPLASVTLALNYAASGLYPPPYHLVNLLLHLAVAWMIVLVALELGLSLSSAAVAASIFAVHPLHTEAVTVVAHRTEMMMALSVLAGLWLAMRGRLWLSVFAYTCGLFSKEQAVVLPGVLLAYDLCMGNVLANARSSGQRLRIALGRYSGYFLVLGAFLTWRFVVFGGFQPPRAPFHLNPLEYVTGVSWLLSTVKMAGHYLWLWVWPVSLAAGDYSYNAIPLVTSWWDGGLWWAILAWGFLFALGAWAFRRDPAAAFCIGLTTVAFLPTSNLLIPLAAPVAERVFYLPSAGLCLLVGVGWERLMRRETSIRRVGWVLIVTICLAFTMRTMLRNQDWASAEALFRSAARAYPTNAKAHALLGDALQNKPGRQDWEQALQVYETALHIYPDFATTDPLFAHNLGVLYIKLDQSSRAVELLTQVVEVRPLSEMAWLNLGRAYRMQEQFALAEAALRHAVALNPGKAELHNVLSRFLIEQGRYAEGLAEVQLALQADPKLLLGLYNQALALEGLGRLEEAAAAYDRLLALGPPQRALEEITQRVTQLRAKMGRPSQSGKAQPRQPGSRSCPPGLLAC